MERDGWIAERGLTFGALRGANRARLPTFRNSKGNLAHSKPDGSDWTPAQWLQAVVGELGEYANMRKKYERGDIDKATFTELAKKELADVQVYLDILAQRCLDKNEDIDHLGVDLGDATTDKFNEVSIRVGSNIRLSEDEWWEV